MNKIMEGKIEKQKFVNRYYFISFTLFILVIGLLVHSVVAALENEQPSLRSNYPTGTEIHFTFLPVVAKPHQPQPGQIVVDSNNRSWLFYNRDANGDGQLDPLFIAGPGDPEEFLYRGSRNSDGTRNGDQMAIINKLIGTGANSIYMQAIRSHGGDGQSDHNPFVNSNPLQGFDEDILNQWEQWFTAMDNAGIIIYFFFYDDSACVWACNSTSDHAVPPAEQVYIETLVNRFEHHGHLIWVIAEEYRESFSTQRVANIAAAIRQADDYNHPIALHHLNGLRFDLPDDPNIDQFAIQYNVGGDALHDGMTTAWQDANGRYNLNMSESSEHGTGATARRNSWLAAMGGAYVMVYQMDIINTAISDLHDLGRLRTFFESTNFYEMAPHSELALGATGYVLAKPGDSYIAYTTNAGSMGLKGMSAGTYNFTWLDTATGMTVNQNGVSVGSGDQIWNKPGGLGSEVAVYIRPSN